MNVIKILKIFYVHKGVKVIPWVSQGDKSWKWVVICTRLLDSSKNIHRLILHIGLPFPQNRDQSVAKQAVKVRPNLSRLSCSFSKHTQDRQLHRIDSLRWLKAAVTYDTK